MAFSFPHLQRRNNVLYFRRALPIDLRQCNRRSEVLFCLHTPNLRKATCKLALASFCYDLIVNHARSNKNVIDPKYMDAVRAYFQRGLLGSEQNNEIMKFTGEAASLTQLQEMLQACDARLAVDPISLSPLNGEVGEVVDMLVSDSSELQEIGSSTPEHARRFLEDQFVRFMRSCTKDAISMRTDPAYSPRSTATVAQGLTHPLSSPTTPPSPFFNEAWDEYVLEHSHAWKKATEAEYQRAAREFSSVDFAGNKRIAEYTRNDLISYRNALVSLPGQRSKLKIYRNLSVSELLKSDIPEDHLLSDRTINEQLTVLNRFFAWCYEIQEFMPKPITTNILLKNVSSRQRAPFGDTELAKLFSPALYRDLVDTPYKFWLPLMGLFTGARISEIAQLNLDDVLVNGGIHAFRILDLDEDQEVKTAAARRLVPIHAKLIEAGILDYIGRLRAAGESRLFPDLTLGSRSPGGPASQHFTRFRNSAGVPAEDSLEREWVFHSFRHTFVTRLRLHDAKHDVALIQQIVGHEKSLFGATSIYTHDFPLSACKSVIDSLEAPPVDIQALRPVLIDILK